MKSVFLNGELKPCEINKSEVLRYSGCREESAEMLRLIEDCIDELGDDLDFRLCSIRLGVKINGDTVDFGGFSVKSKDLCKNLSGCGEVIVFAATVGLKIDRIIKKYSSLSPSRAVVFDAIAAERIEAFISAFETELSEMGYSLKPRFSAGYGDLPLEAQRDIVEILDCCKKIGVTLNDSLVLSPSKSVTAFIGVRGNINEAD